MEPTFVTGATGYVGRRFLRAASAAGTRLVALARDPAAAPEELRKLAGVEWVRGDLLEPAAWKEALARCPRVVHLAATTGKARRTEHFRVNAEGTKVLLDAARVAGVRGFLHVSTISAAFRDRRHYPYAESKLAAEEHVRASGLPFTIVRPTVILGPAAPVLEGLSKMARMPLIPLFGGGKAKFQPIWVDDVARSLVEILSEDRFGGETIDLGGPDVVTARELLQRIRVRAGKGAGRGLPVPLAPARAALALVEPLLLPVLPLTAGQLCPFANDGTAAPSAFVAERRGRFRGVDESLRESLPGA